MKINMKQYAIFVGVACICVVAIFVLAFTRRQPVVAQSSYTATMIGGKTEGYQDVCCTGMILAFESVDSKNPLILDGDAMYQPGLSTSYSYYLETASGSCALGKITGQMICLDPGEECYSGTTYPLITTIGTSESGCEYVGGTAGASF